MNPVFIEENHVFHIAPPLQANIIYFLCLQIPPSVEPRKQRSFRCFLSTLFLLSAAFLIGSAFIVTDYKEVKYTFSSITTD